MNDPNGFHVVDTIPVLTDEWPSEPQVDFQKRMTSVILCIDEGGVIEYSTNGCDLHGIIKLRDQWLSFDNVDVEKLYFRVSAGAACVRVWGWEKQR